MAAIFGLVNSILYSLLGDDSFMGPFEWEPQQWTRSILYALCGMVVGLLVSGAFLRFATSGLRGSFFGRYGLMVFNARKTSPTPSTLSTTMSASVTISGG